ncbi:MAG: hypothetical protein H6621_03720 [Halobacteriovoraceae bacterium]|nr:hypothetical protein [Halobacteriovoraceae bacterium]MCB9094156.1 hypothetical protein [Halobacteriovoraceae bacterium]
MKKILELILMVSMIAPSFVLADNLEGENGLHRIVVSEDLTGEYTFYHVYVDEKTHETIKVMLGHQGYTQEELQEIMASEKTEAIIKTSGSLLAAAILATVGFYLGTATAFSAGFMTFSTRLADILYPLAGSGLLGSLPLWFRKLNPIRQFKQANVLKKYNFIEDDVTVSDSEVEKSAELLSEILD